MRVLLIDANVGAGPTGEQVVASSHVFTVIYMGVSALLQTTSPFLLSISVVSNGDSTVAS